MTYAITGCAMGVHEVPGNGFQEVIYQRCLVLELADAGIEERLTVEPKAVINLEEVHLAQARNQVISYDFAGGVLLNFGAMRLQFKLIFNPKDNLSTLLHPCEYYSIL